MPKKEKRYKYALPELPAEYSGCPEAVICIPAAWIPLLSGHLAKLEQRHEWASKEDWLAGYQFIAELEECLIMSCLGTGIQTMIDEQRRLYRLMDAIYNGTQYTAVEFGEIGGGGGSWGGAGGGGGSWGDAEGGGGTWGSTEDGEIVQVPGDTEPTYYLVEPPLPAAPPDYTLNPPVAPALRARVERLEHLIDNLANGRVYLTDDQNPTEEPLDDEISIRERIRLMQGEINAGWFGIGGEDATLADIVEALRVGDSGTRASLWDTFREILQAGGSAASIIQLLQDLFADTVEAGTEGAMLAMMIASMLANAAIAQQNQEQLDRIIQALDGGAEIAPTSETNNAVTLLDSIRNKLIEADPDSDSLLEEIRKLLT